MHGIKFFPCSFRSLLFIALLGMLSLPLAADLRADEGPVSPDVQQGLDQYGIRPAKAGEETVTGQTATGQEGGIGSGPIIRDESGTYILPSGEKMSADEFHNKYPIFSGVIIGPPPAASDGPTTYQGTPSLPYEITEETKQVIEEQKAFEAGMPPWLAWSGSRQFGDDIGVDRQPEFGHPGQPFGGNPIGSWIHYGPSRNTVTNDALLQNALNNNDFAAFSALFRGQFGADPVEVPFGESQSR